MSRHATSRSPGPRPSVREGGAEWPRRVGGRASRLFARLDPSRRATATALCRPLSIGSRENIPLYRNSEMTYVSRIPAHSRGAIVRSSCSRAGLAVDAAASGAKGAGREGSPR